MHRIRRGGDGVLPMYVLITDYLMNMMLNNITYAFERGDWIDFRR